MFCSLRGIKKKVSAHGLRPVYRGAYIRYFIINPSISCCPLFPENYLNSKDRINQVVNKHTLDYHPSPSQLISRIHPLIFRLTSTGLIFTESLLNFFLNLYILPWLRISFKFIVLRLLQLDFWVKKLNLFIFSDTPK